MRYIRDPHEDPAYTGQHWFVGMDHHEGMVVYVGKPKRQMMMSDDGGLYFRKIVHLGFRCRDGVLRCCGDQYPALIREEADDLLALLDEIEAARRVVAAARAVSEVLCDLHSRLCALDTGANANETLCLISAYPRSLLADQVRTVLAAYDRAIGAGGEG